jgi:hypothetical protein
MQKRWLAVSVTVGALAMPALASADKVKTCTTSGTPHKNFTTTNTQTSACNSNSDTGTQDVSVQNPAGHQPGGQQP